MQLHFTYDFQVYSHDLRYPCCVAVVAGKRENQPWVGPGTSRSTVVPPISPQQERRSCDWGGGSFAARRRAGGPEAPIATTCSPFHCARSGGNLPSTNRMMRLGAPIRPAGQADSVRGEGMWRSLSCAHEVAVRRTPPSGILKLPATSPGLTRREPQEAGREQGHPGDCTGERLRRSVAYTAWG